MAIHIQKWKSKHLRKKRSQYRCRLGGAPKSYYYWYNRVDRNKSNRLISDLINERISEEEFIVTLPGRHKHSATWDYW